MKFLVPQQTEAESDQYLIDCFHDSGFISKLLNEQFSIVSGRKGTGKTALAKFLQSKFEKHGISYCYRLSIDDLSTTVSESKVEEILFYILARTIRLLLENKQVLSSSEKYLRDFLEQNGLSSISDYKAFILWSKKNSAGFSLGQLVGFARGEIENNYQRATVSNSVSGIFSSLLESLPEEKKTLIFIDDISDHLDSSDKTNLVKEIEIIRDVLTRLDKFNASLSEQGKGLRFICLIRDDLFEYMEGSNINKLKNNSLNLVWNEESFCSLLIRRLPFFDEGREEWLIDPKKSIQKLFPNDIFQDTLSSFQTNQYSTKFYAYMMAISFNRPRDFLKFCYAMRSRLSDKHPALFENIDSAEGEYDEYFVNELKDELYVSGKILDYAADLESIYGLIDSLVRDDGFVFGHLKTTVSSQLGIKTSTGNKKIIRFIKEMWRYGILGFKQKEGELIRFKYMNPDKYLPQEIKDFSFYLHRGLWWFARKRRNRS